MGTKEKVNIYEDFPELENITGKLQYSMLNDCMFKLVLQSNEKVLRGLLCSLLHLKPEEIDSIEVMNPFILGTAINDKTFILDLKIMLNNNKIVNIELQVMDKGNWPERSLLYTCRAFDNLNKGDEYIDVKPVQHIGILDFDLKNFLAEFYLEYKLMNTRNHKVYTSKFTINVLNLRQIELATEEDKFWEIDYWAQLFKATTWEELKMLAEKNDTMCSAAKSIYEIIAEEEAQLNLEARERYIKKEQRFEEMKVELAEKENALARKDDELLKNKDELAKKDNELAKQEERIKILMAELEALKK